MTFSAHGLGFSYGLREATFDLPTTGFVAIAGPNGAGKSTLVSILAGVRRSYSGSCKYESVELRDWPRRKFAQQVAFLPQSARIDFPFTAEQVVLMGRTPHAGGWYDSAEDLAAVETAMAITDTVTFRDRDVRALSGGERQRVFLAAALAQQPRALLLDEPATFLDLKHQLAMFRLLRDLSRTLLVIAVTHDLNLALRYADHALVLENGRLVEHGPPRELFKPDLIARVFGITATLDSSGKRLEYEG